MESTSLKCSSIPFKLTGLPLTSSFQVYSRLPTSLLLWRSGGKPQQCSGQVFTKQAQFPLASTSSAEGSQGALPISQRDIVRLGDDRRWSSYEEGGRIMETLEALDAYIRRRT